MTGQYVLDLSWLFLCILLLPYSSLGTRDKRADDANDTKTKEQNSMFNVHTAICNNVVYAWNKKKYSERDTNDSEHNSSVEDCRVLHNIFYTFLLD